MLLNVFEPGLHLASCVFREKLSDAQQGFLLLLLLLIHVKIVGPVCMKQRCAGHHGLCLNKVAN